MSTSTKAVFPIRTSQQNGEIELLESRVHQFQKDIQEFTSRKTECLRRLNDIKPSTTIFPDEVLCSIFEQACSDTNLFPVTLGAVSSHWRAVAWSWPILWTSLSISPKVVGKKYVPSRYLEVVQLYFSNVRHLSIALQLRDIEIIAGRVSFSSPDVPREVIIDFIFSKYPGKLRALTCTGMDKRWWHDICRFAKPDKLNNLEAIALGWTEIIDYPTPISFLPTRLTKVSLSGVNVPAELAWDRITHLQLSKLPMDLALSLLLHCHSLEEYYCSSAPWVNPTTSRFSRLLRASDVSLPNLRKLGWWFQKDSWSDFIAKSIRFPSLLVLQSTTPERNLVTPIPSQFIENAPHLQVFTGSIRHIWDGPSFGRYTVNIVDADVKQGITGILVANELQDLCICELDIDDLRFILDQLTVRHEPVSWGLVPHLRTLSLHVPELSSDLFYDTILASFTRFLRSRRNESKMDSKECSILESIRLSPIEYLSPPKDAPAVIVEELDVIRELVREGLRVELVGMSGTTVVWP